ncbi:MAG: hypothetical protein JWR69_2539 [Pedosphaera sp.]|nr:hypothetical protein [Pedosphaera sp.]
MKKCSPYLGLVFLVTVCFTLATCLQCRPGQWTARAQSDNFLNVLLGDGRRMFANHFFVKADIYFHSGYYPSIFEQAARQSIDTKHMTEEPHDEKDEKEEHEHEQTMNFLGAPKDWIDRFGRHFYPSSHSHLEKPGDAREILPWLRLSADMDPERIETYTVAAFWLRKRLGKVDEAEQFLREGLRANPTSSEILFELGQLYFENRHDPVRARNLWELGLRRWQAQAETSQKPDDGMYLKLIINLAHLEEEQGDLRKTLYYRELEVKVSPQPIAVQKEIDELKQKLATPIVH